MKIRDIETIAVGTPEPHRGGDNFLFVKLTTGDGRVGYGECPWAEHRLRTLEQLVEDMAPFVRGTDPHDIEQLRQELDQDSHWFNIPGPLQSQVYAAIEMACWDLLGKSAGEPVYNLLGGCVNESLRAYTYIHYEWEPSESPSKAADTVESYADRGFTAVKLDPIPPFTGNRAVSTTELDYAEDVVASIRSRVGNECEIILGTHGQLTTDGVIRFAHRLEQYDPMWLEEPVPPERIDEMAAVGAATDIPIATGERITSIHLFSELLERDAVDVVQPNIGFLGLLGAKKVAGMAETHYAQVAPWIYCGPIQWAAALHLDVATPNFLVQEGIEEWNGFHRELVEGAPTFEDGTFDPPSGPGLGVELDESLAEEYPPNK
ncbi:mandelate racemase/muconate lactonizing enzyme family protein [Halobellus salinisoli]|uniref:mandelate racemase/muconate lactonizing enzyme family protein n=1 Tax=Halobellus salinisoli TaxID=3108500 RepID=UPI0030084151